jgi:tripartite-type tricarboxylate transporter receptor subunit TctC
MLSRHKRAYFYCTKKSFALSMQRMAVVIGFFLSLTVGSAEAEAQEDPYYEGKTLTLYVGRTPGSGADLAARVFAQFWSQYIPGEPTVIVRNLPGGGGTRVWNYGAEVAASDGFHVLFSPTNGAAAVLKEPGLRADFSTMPFVGGLLSPNMAYIRTDKVASPQELLTAQGLRFGGQNPALRFDLLGRLALDALGVEYQYVTGFPGGADVFNAIRRGEVDIQVASLGLYRFSIEPTLVEEGLAIPLWHNPSADTEGNVTALDVVPDIPSYMEFYRSVHGKDPSGEVYEMYKWILPRVNNIVYAALLPPGTPEEPTRILRETFIKVTEDPDYQAEEQRMYGFSLPLVGAEEGTEILRSLYDVPAEVASFLKAYIDEVR